MLSLLASTLLAPCDAEAREASSPEARAFSLIDRRAHANLCYADLSLPRLTANIEAIVTTFGYYGIAANTALLKGQMVGKDASGNLIKASSASCVKVLGASRADVDNTTPPSGQAKNAMGLGGTAGEGSAGVDFGVNCYDNDTGTPVAESDCPCAVFVKDDHTVTKDSSKGLPAGVALAVGDSKGGGDKQVRVWQGPAGTAAALALQLALGQTNAAASPYKARAYITSLQAYTGTGTNVLTETANGAWQVQDGITCAVGDVVFVEAGTTNLSAAADAGPWVITSLGSAGSKWVLTRPTWWQTGAIIPNGAIVELGGEGTNFPGMAFKSFASIGSAVIGTNDPVMFIRDFTVSVTLVTGFVTLTGQTFPGLKSTTKSVVTFTPTNFNGAANTVSYRTGAYVSGGAATVAGAKGTSSVSITALVAAGTFNTADVGTGLLSIGNW